MSEEVQPTAFDEAVKRTLKAKEPRKPRGKALGPGERYVTDGRVLLTRAVRGEISVRAPRKVGWIAKHIGTTRRVTGRFLSGRARPTLAQGIAIAALFPWIPVESWLTEAERAKLFDTTCTGQRILKEPAPNPKTWRRKEKADERQVTLEDVIARRSAELSEEMKQSFPVTDPELDAPDGAVVDGHERSGDARHPVPERTVELEPDLPDWID